MNLSDGEKIEKILSDLKFQKTDSEKEADVIIVVSCSIRQVVIDKILRRAKNWQRKRKAKLLTTIVTGCVVDADKEKMSGFFDYVLDIKEIEELKNILRSNISLSSVIPAKAGIQRTWIPGHPGLDPGPNDIEVDNYLNISSNHQSSFQAYVPIMTGCNNFCSYCVVPYVRGREKSRPAKEIINECKKLIEQGYKEIVLLGQNVNSYDGGKLNFPKLLSEIDKIKGDFWMRFLTSHPKDLSNELIDVMKNGRHITPYLHLAVQSGDNKILQAMNRKYKIERFVEIVQKARKAIPGIMISTDVIVGFPGETKKQFNNTLKLFKQVGFDMAYISKFCARKGTEAAKLKDNILDKEKENRKNIINEELKKSALEINRRYIGRKVKVLVDEFKNGKCSGKTDTFKTVVFTGDKKMIGKFIEVEIKRADTWALFG